MPAPTLADRGDGTACDPRAKMNAHMFRAVRGSTVLYPSDATSALMRAAGISVADIVRAASETTGT